MKAKDQAFRKRTQIDKTNRAMFMWVAGVSVLLGFAIVASIFLTQMIFFNERVLQEKGKTVSNLQANNKNITELEDQVRALDANQALINTKTPSEDKAIQVVLDALPSEANSLALGASLQGSLLANIDGITLNSLQVTPVAGLEALEGDTVSYDTSTSTGQNEISFNFSVSGSQDSLKKVLQNLEKSIRTIKVVSLQIENEGSTLNMKIGGKAFYEPVKEVKLTDKTVK